MKASRPAKRMTIPKLKMQLGRAEKSFHEMFSLDLPSNGEIQILEQKMMSLDKRVHDYQKELQAVYRKHRPELKAEKKKTKAVSRSAKERDLKNKQLVLQIKRATEKKVASQEKERRRIDFENKQKQVIPTRLIDQTQLIRVQLDKNTAVFIKPGQDPEEARRKFRERNKPEKF